MTHVDFNVKVMGHFKMLLAATICLLNLVPIGEGAGHRNYWDMEDQVARRNLLTGITNRVGARQPVWQSWWWHRVVFFGPCINVRTNIANKFLQLISRHFPKGHKLHKIFNRNNVKVSYSCMPNVGSIISSHNKSVLESYKAPCTFGCNCLKKDECSLHGNCLDRNVVYRAKWTQ